MDDGFNSMQREKPHLPLTWQESRRDVGVLEENLHTGAAWPSSARVVRCWVKSRNERNPCHQLLRKGTLMRLPVTNRRKVGMTSGPLRPLWVGLHVIQWPVQRAANPRGGANPRKPVVVRIVVCNSTA